jgi:MFS family permease
MFCLPAPACPLGLRRSLAGGWIADPLGVWHPEPDVDDANSPFALPAGMTIATIFVGQSLGMAGIVSFPALLPQFRQLWSLSGGEAGLISGIYFAGYILAVPVLSALTDRLDPRRIYVLSLLCGVVTAFGFAAFADGAASAALWRFLQGAAFGGAHMPGMRALCEAVPPERQTRSVAVYTASFTVGVSLSYALSGALAGAFGWRSGFALLAAGPLAAAAIAWIVLPPLSRAAAPVSSWLPPLGSIFRNRRALVFVCVYGLHNGEVSALRAWLVALLVFAADRAGRQDLTGYATLVATIANLCGTPLIVAVNELAARWERRSVVAAIMVVSAMAGVLLAAAAAWSPFAAALAAIFAVAVATADAGTINAGLVAASKPERRGAFLAVQAVSGFGASAVTPMLFGLILDLAGGAGSEAAWIAAFAVQAMIGVAWPLAYLRSRVRGGRGVPSRAG